MKKINRKINNNFKRILVSLLLVVFLLPLFSTTLVAREDTRLRVGSKLPATLMNIDLEDGSLKDYKPRVETSQSTMTKIKNFFTRFKQSDLESSYDIRSHIKSGYQGPLDICWTYGNKNLLESYMSLKFDYDIEISPRHMDYATTSQIDPRYNRSAGTGAIAHESFNYFVLNTGPVKEENFPSDFRIDEFSEEDLRKNIEDIYLEGFQLLPSIHKDFTSGERRYVISEFHTEDFEATPEEVELLRDDMKRHIKDKGAISVGIPVSMTGVEYSAEQYIYVEDYEQPDHNISIIGWDDNFCADNPHGSVTGLIPENPGAWLVSDSNNPYGNQFYYIAYDSQNIEAMMYIATDFSIGDRFNIYEYDLIGMNDVISIDTIGMEGEALPVNFINFYEKETSENEYLNKVGLYTFPGHETKVYFASAADIEYGRHEERGTLIATVPSSGRFIEYVTVDVDVPVKIHQGEFGIVLETRQVEDIGDGPGVVSTPVMDEDCEESFAIIGNTIYPLGYTLPVRAYTSGKVLDSSAVTHVVSYDLNGGEGHFPSVNIEEGNYVVNPQIPTREGYTFNGWTPDPAKTPITKNTTFVANWTKNEETPGGGNEDPDPNENPNPKPNEKPEDKPDNTATFVVGNGEIVYIEIGSDGYVVNIPDPKPINGYKFLGWNPDPKKTKANENTVFYALWEKIGEGNQNGNTETEYTPGSKNDGTQAPIRIPDAGKDIMMVFVIVFISSMGVVFFIRYRSIDK